MASYRAVFDKSIQVSLKTGMDMMRDFPESRAAIKRIAVNMPKAKRRRELHKKNNIIVPPLLIISTTEQCNLKCKGCYSHANCREDKAEMTRPQIDNLLEQAVLAGCSMVLLAGGEPLFCDDWLEAAAAQPELLALVFTNGTLLNDARADWFSQNRNLLPLFSIEGSALQTDERRGIGTAQRVEQAMRLMEERSVPFGISVTTGEHNIVGVTDRDFLKVYKDLGCRVSVFVEYVPVDDTDGHLALTEESKLKLYDFCDNAAAKEGILPVVFPGDEAAYGGCLAAGRGFAHISAYGELEPCPFAAYSDRNVLTTSLLDALASPLFMAIRNESHLLHEGLGGCALRNQNQLVNL